jgi:hypothetical protein
MPTKMRTTSYRSSLAYVAGPSIGRDQKVTAPTRTCPKQEPAQKVIAGSGAARVLRHGSHAKNVQQPRISERAQAADTGVACSNATMVSARAHCLSRNPLSSPRPPSQHFPGSSHSVGAPTASWMVGMRRRKSADQAIRPARPTPVRTGFEPVAKNSEGPDYVPCVNPNQRMAL